MASPELPGSPALLKLVGLSAFPITPSAADGTIDTGALRALLVRLTRAGVDSVGLLGSTGSYPYFARAQRRRAIEAAVEVTGATPLLVGIGALRTDETVLLAQDAKAAGAAVGLLAPVSYTPLLDDEVFEHFATVAREGGLPLCIYDNPGTTHFSVSPTLAGRLSRIPGVVAFKGGAPDATLIEAHLSTLRGAVPPDFSVGMAADWNVTEALLAGCDAWYSVAAGLFPQPCVNIVQAVRAGDATRARHLNEALMPLWALLRRYTGCACHVCRGRPARGVPRRSRRVRSCHSARSARREIATTLAELGLR